jgi:hypothetical protein
MDAPALLMQIHPRLDLVVALCTWRSDPIAHTRNDAAVRQREHERTASGDSRPYRSSGHLQAQSHNREKF